MGRAFALPLPGESPTMVVGSALMGYFSLGEEEIPLRPPLPSPGEMMLHGTGSPRELSRGGEVGETADTFSCIGIPQGLGLKQLHQ